jgi:hypothetical protein
LNIHVQTPVGRTAKAKASTAGNVSVTLRGIKTTLARQGEWNPFGTPDYEAGAGNRSEPGMALDEIRDDGLKKKEKETRNSDNNRIRLRLYLK